MNQIKQSKLRLLVGAVPVALAAAVALTLLFALRYDFSADIGHFAVDSGWFYAFAGCCAVSVVLGTVLSLTMKAEAASAPLRPLSFPSAVTSLCVAACAAVLFAVSLWQAIRTEAWNFPVLGELITLPGIALFFVLGALPAARGGSAHVICGIVACLSANCTLFKGYFDFSLPLNSPIRNGLTLMEAAFLLLLFAEMRTLLGKSAPRFSRFAAQLAVSLMGGISLGLLLARVFAAESVPAEVPVARCVLCLLAAAHTVLRCTEKQ